MKKISVVSIIFIMICLLASCELVGVKNEEQHQGHKIVDEICVDCLIETATPTSDEYFEFTQLADGTYAIAAKDIRNVPSAIIIPSTHNGSPVTAIAEKAFSARELFDKEGQYYDYFYCNVKAIVIPNSVQVIDQSAFEKCQSLSVVIMGDSVVTIGNSAFLGCPLRELKLSPSLKTIGAMAFGYTGIERLVLPNSVTTVGGGAFEGSMLISITIPESVTSWGYCFNMCSFLREIVNNSSIVFESGIGGNLPMYGVLEVHSGESKIVEKDGYLFYKVNGQNYLIRYCGNETRLILPSDINGESYELYDGAFSWLSDVTEISIPEGVTTIPNATFRSCRSLKKVYLPKSLTKIVYVTFSDCGALTDVYYGGSKKDAEGIKIEKIASLADVDVDFEGITEGTIHYNHAPLKQ